MLKELLNWGAKRDLVELMTPRRSFADVILPERTRQSLYEALMQIEKHSLIFQDWGLGERHNTGTGLAFNFAGPPGTGKTICAEAVARALGKKLLKVRYSELESCWAGESGKNVVAVFREARQQDAVLLFDEADSVASRRFAGTSWGYEREANQTVNILLSELEDYPGVVIFATNLATNFDPAFERRIRTHILFEMPGLAEREKIWHVQIHPQKTPLASDVDFPLLAERYEVSGGDIKNAVLKAAQMAAAEDGADRDKAIHQRHLIAGIERVIDSKKVMAQSLFGPSEAAAAATSLLPAWQQAMTRSEERFGTLDDDLQLCRRDLEIVGGDLSLCRSEVETVATDLERWRAELESVGGDVTRCREELAGVQTALTGLSDRGNEAEQARATDAGALREELAALRTELHEAARSQAQAWENRLSGLTLIRMPRWASVSLFLLILAVTGLGWTSAALHWLP
jgi:SpoVK/Ycf46/Vps4 family AAA+-type ATPase